MKHIAWGRRLLGRPWRAGVMALAVIGLGGCSILPAAQPVVRYELPLTPIKVEHATAVPMVIAVATPMANQALNSDRILVVPQGYELSVYKGARWNDNAPVLLRNSMMLALRDSGGLEMVVPAATGLRTDVALVSDLSAFQVRYVQGQPVVHLALDAALISAADKAPLSAHRFRIEQAVAGDHSVPDVVQAYGQAVQALNQQLLQWVGPALQAYTAQRTTGQTTP